MISIVKFSKGYNSIIHLLTKNVGGVYVLILCTSSAYALYLYKIS